jgi:hypothetical protein
LANQIKWAFQRFAWLGLMASIQMAIAETKCACGDSRIFVFKARKKAQAEIICVGCERTR